MGFKSIPNVDESTKIYSQVMNIVVSSRDSWTSRQKEILDMKRVHDDIIDVGFRGFSCLMFSEGRRSKGYYRYIADTKEAFATGEDNDDGTLLKQKTFHSKKLQINNY